MRRQLTLWTFLVAAAACFGLYLLGHDVERLEKRLAELNRQILHEEQTIQVLKAEWVYLNRPERLQELSARYADKLGLAPIESVQMVGFDTVKARLSELAEAARVARLEMLARLPQPRSNPGRQPPEAVDPPVARAPAPVPASQPPRTVLPPGGLHLASSGGRT